MPHVLLLVALMVAQSVIQPNSTIVGNSNVTAPPGTLAFVSIAKGDSSNQAGTCNTGGGTTCVVTLSANTGDLLQITSVTATARTISSISCTGTLVQLQGLDTNGQTTTGTTGTTTLAYIVLTASCTNPVVTFSGTTNTGYVIIVRSTPAGGCIPALDAYSETKSTAGFGSPFTANALTLSGGSDVNMVEAYNNGSSGTTAVASPYNTNAIFAASNNLFAGGASAGTTGAAAVWTAAGNTSGESGEFAMGCGVAPSHDWTAVDSHGGTAGNVPAVADLNASTVGFIGGGNSSSNPGWAVPSNGTTKLTYATDISGNIPSTTGGRFLFGGGTTTTLSIALIFSWATANGTCVSVCGALGWRPPNGTTEVDDGQWVWTNIPNTENSSTVYSLGTMNDTGGANDIINLQIVPNTGTSLPLHLECAGSDQGNIFTGTSSHWYWVARHYVPGGTSSMTIFDNDGVTQLGTKTCSTPSGGTVTNVGFPGISGAESEVTGHVIEFGPWKICTIGPPNHTVCPNPMLPATQ